MKHPINWLNSFAYALNGMFEAVKERNVRFHLLSAILVCGICLQLKLSAIEWGLISSAIAAVLITEFINTAIENLCDFLTADYSIHIKKIKDIAAAAVLLSALYAVTIALLFILPKIF
ncbi:MAG: diacylglycerol kinase family protein [Cytophaga sp.]|uniref:diacylglycerol kinase family protein n=1 Tax=Cytophaga sp. TaxID=29535 RepID=UPI003F80A730